MNEIREWLSDPVAIAGLCALFGSLIFLVMAIAFRDNYERGGYEPVHRRPRKPEPWHREPSGEHAAVVDTRVPARHRHETMGEATTLIAHRAVGVRARVETIEPGGETHAGQPTEVHHPFETGHVRELEEQGDEQEEGSADRERWEDEGRPVSDGEEGSAHAQAPQEVNGWFQNTITGEIVFFDERGQKVEWRDA